MARCARVLLISLAMIAASCSVGADELMNGQLPPQFQLPDQNGKLHRLSDYQGRWLVLYFYPKDDTPGCTEEACRFRDDIVQLQTLGAQVLGVSVDSTEDHAEFARKYSLPFPLLADVGGKTARAYGSLRNWGILKIARRHTFIIAPDGRIAKVYRDVTPKTHSTQVIDDLKVLQRAYGSAAS